MHLNTEPAIIIRNIGGLGLHVVLLISNRPVAIGLVVTGL